jgi:Fe-S-cluster containining protein
MKIDWEKVPPGQLFLAAMQQAHECLMCGKCCRGMEGIALNRTDTLRMSKHLGMSEREFIKKYTTQNPKKPSDRHYILEGEDKHCPFLTSHGCSQYEGRGQVCRFYPWTSPDNMAGMKEKKPITIYQRCDGMKLTYIHVLEDAEVIPVELANQILNGITGKLCFLLAIDMEGRGDIHLKKLLAEIGLDELPPAEEIRSMARLYAVAFCSRFNPLVREDTRRKLYGDLNH